MLFWFHSLFWELLPIFSPGDWMICFSFFLLVWLCYLLCCGSPPGDVAGVFMDYFYYSEIVIESVLVSIVSSLYPVLLALLLLVLVSLLLFLVLDLFGFVGPFDYVVGLVEGAVFLVDLVFCCSVRDSGISHMFAMASAGLLDFFLCSSCEFWLFFAGSTFCRFYWSCIWFLSTYSWYWIALPVYASPPDWDINSCLDNYLLMINMLISSSLDLLFLLSFM